jgi:hypothetical protein
VGNKWGRRQRRLQEKHRWYFEEAAARVIATGHATVDLGVTSIDVSLKRSIHTLGRRHWLEILSAGGGHGGTSVAGHGANLASVIADHMISSAASFSGVLVPTRPPQVE